jgi:hypothetical protein
MVVAFLLLLVIALLLGIGVVVQAATWLIWLALVLGVLWIVGWFVGAGAAAASEAVGEARRRRWYSW